MHVVLNHRVLGGGEVPHDPLLDRLEDLLVRRVGVGDQHALRLHDRRHNVEPRCAHRSPRLHKVDDGVGQPEAARGLDGPADELDLGLAGRLRLVLGEELLGQVRKRSNNSLPRERRDIRDVVFHRGLHSQPAPSEMQVDLAVHLLRRDRLLNHVEPRDAHIDVPLANIRCNVGRRQEHQRHRHVVAVGDVDSVWPLVIQPRPLHQLHALLVQPPLLGDADQQVPPVLPVVRRVRHRDVSCRGSPLKCPRRALH
mmetsp:Transcript_39710/g.99421  ORF Transcript_39710/g.99421 Transcript_39710/m.99421 type:complete len:254 (-) Transcript_39710:11-772(-)